MLNAVYKNTKPPAAAAMGAEIGSVERAIPPDTKAVAVPAVAHAVPAATELIPAS